jgi:multidrug efflux pump subunit AcrB
VAAAPSGAHQLGRLPLASVVSVEQSVQPNTLTTFQQLNSATIQGVPFPGRTVGEALDFMKAKAAEILPFGFTMTSG